MTTSSVLVHTNAADRLDVARRLLAAAPSPQDVVAIDGGQAFRVSVEIAQDAGFLDLAEDAPIPVEVVAVITPEPEPVKSKRGLRRGKKNDDR